ncbi:MAG: DUF4184 family protein [Actinomycetota bacterium]
MPVTFPAHQGLILPAKLRWPGAIDATALCIAAGSPDLAYSLSPWLNRQSHTAIGVLVLAVPVAVVAAWITRRWAASGIFAALPDLGPLRLRSYRVLAVRRPPWWQTLTSALLGAGSHVVVDGFTHAGRWGANWAGLNGVIGSLPGRGELTAARVLQYVGHLGGSLAFVLVLVVVASSGRLATWYGAEAVALARSVTATGPQRASFALLAIGPPVVAAIVADDLGRSPLFLAVTVSLPALLLAGTVVGSWLDGPGVVGGDGAGGTALDPVADPTPIRPI